MGAPATSTKQVERFHREMVELVKKYQFRDRNQTACCGLSVTQCYALESLNRFGPLSMNQLAEKVYLSISTVTRVVDRLVARGYVHREEGKHDRRSRVIALTEQGKHAYADAWRHVFDSEKEILESFPSAHRDMLIDFLERLNQAVDEWQIGSACKS